MKRIAAALCCMLLSAAGWSQETASFAERLAEARATWQQAGIAQYEYGYNKFCECHAETPPETLVSVAAGVVTDVRHRMVKTGDIVPAREGSLDLYWTIDDLLALLERASSGTASVQADFDPLTGVPQRLYIDYLPDLIGDEIDIRVISFDSR